MGRGKTVGAKAAMKRKVNGHKTVPDEPLLLCSNESKQKRRKSGLETKSRARKGLKFSNGAEESRNLEGIDRVNDGQVVRQKKTKSTAKFMDKEMSFILRLKVKRRNFKKKVAPLKKKVNILMTPK